MQSKALSKAARAALLRTSRPSSTTGGSFLPTASSPLLSPRSVTSPASTTRCRHFSSKQQSPASTLPSSSSSSSNVYHAGLRTTTFTSDCIIQDESQIIPIFRVMNYDGQLESGWELPFTKEELLEKYKFMVTLSVYDEMMYNIQRQGRISFYIQNMGEEAAQTGSGSALSPDDHLFCQYRELGVLMWRGFTLENALDQCFSNADDPSKGRQMPISYCNKKINLHTIATPLTTQVPHASGAGYAFKIAGEKKCAVTYFGEGAASEGDFHGALNFAAVLKSQTLFICRNNGYAISTPVKDQYAGDGIAIRGLSYGMKTVRVDGNDLCACYIATKRAREMCIENSEPVLLEFMTYRMGHHSTSDDSSQYRPEGEFEAWNQQGINPIARIYKFLHAANMWSVEEEKVLRQEAKKTMLQEMKKIEKKKFFPILAGIFDDVYDKPTGNLIEQRASLKAHLAKHPDKYDVSRYEADTA